VSKVTKFGKMVKFVEGCCKIVTKGTLKLVAIASRVRNLYYLDCQPARQNVNAAKSNSNAKEQVRQCYGHSRVKGRQKLARDKSIDGNKSGVVASCVEDNHSRNKFPVSRATESKVSECQGSRIRTTEEVSNLKHSDVSGKMSSQSLVLEEKDGLSSQFLEWKDRRSQP